VRFAEFLKSIDAPLPMVYAAYVRSEQLLADKAEPAERKKIEEQLGGPQAKAIRDDLGTNLRAAVNLKIR